MEQGPGMRLTLLNPDSNLQTEDELSVRSLSRTWQPLVQPLLHSVDVADTTRLGVDEVEGKGSFNSKDLYNELREMHRSRLENELGLSFHKIGTILRRADFDRDGVIEYKDFIETLRQYRLSSEQKSQLAAIVHAFAYAEEYRDCLERPPIFMLSITILQLIFFAWLATHLVQEHRLTITWDGPVPFCSRLIYNPRRRFEIWRFITYMLVHIGVGHLVFNLLMQLIVGVFLELQQEGFAGSLRVAVVYMAGVLAGSLGTSLTDPMSFIAGASGGVYALIAAHLATLILNWKEDSAVRVRKVIYRPLTRILRLVFITFLTIHDVALAVYIRLVLRDEENRTGFMGHLSGALAGLLIGVFVLDNRHVKPYESILQWICFAIFAIAVIFAILWNCFGNEWTDSQLFLDDDLDLYSGSRPI